MLQTGSNLEGDDERMITRRTILAGISLAPGLPLLTRAAWAGEEATAADKLNTSRLVYLTPIKSDGEESRCKAEIWFAHDAGHVYVVTPPDAWRAEAVGRGLVRARLWVGDFGVWTRSDGAFREAPEYMATASIETDAGVHARILESMGSKYAASGWSNWGPRFQQGLVDGSRVMIRYALDA